MTICIDPHYFDNMIHGKTKFCESSLPLLKDSWKTFQQALKIYSNAHRGSGIYSELSTNLLERARNNILNEVCAASNVYKRAYTI